MLRTHSTDATFLGYSTTLLGSKRHSTVSDRGPHPSKYLLLNPTHALPLLRPRAPAPTSLHQQESRLPTEGPSVALTAQPSSSGPKACAAFAQAPGDSDDGAPSSAAQPRKALPFVMLDKYSSDFDANGVVYWIATKQVGSW